MIIVKTPEEMERMRPSCRMAAAVLDRVAKTVGPGVTTKELDDFAAREMKSLGGESAFFGYRGYPGHICVSVNDEVVHGIPGNRKIQYGDIVSLDVGIILDGYVGDNATTVAVGLVPLRTQQLLSATQQALAAGISQARAG